MSRGALLFAELEMRSGNETTKKDAMVRFVACRTDAGSLQMFLRRNRAIVMLQLRDV